MSLLSPDLSVTINLNKSYKTQDINKLLVDFISDQYPSSIQSSNKEILFSNNMFRFKVRRGNNLIKGFFNGKLDIQQIEKDKYIIRFSGKLYRSIAISLIQGILFLAVWIYAMQLEYIFIPLTFIVLSYIAQVMPIQYLFPRALARVFEN